MRLQEVILNVNELGINGECGNNAFIIVYSDGIAKLTYLPAHGETKVVTHQGKVKWVKFDGEKIFKIFFQPHFYMRLCLLQRTVELPISEWKEK